MAGGRALAVRALAGDHLALAGLYERRVRQHHLHVQHAAHVLQGGLRRVRQEQEDQRRGAAEEVRGRAEEARGHAALHRAQPRGQPVQAGAVAPEGDGQDDCQRPDRVRRAGGRGDVCVHRVRHAAAAGDAVRQGLLPLPLLPGQGDLRPDRHRD